MNIRTLIDGGLQYLTKRRTDNMGKKQRYQPVGKTHVVCGSCGGEIVKVNDNTDTRVCWKCGKKAPSK
jgi:predicted amidophosphoribosyltransferase